ncbi:hypothetical protein [Neisseria canis]|uniref:Uncharacterized protein n=1 Tax=Neisseria canis TaxID=493 RepID=A0A1X3CXB0_9NEIS|nr:hypothetical protein [Neisseria canis]OSI12094.1 hypothetical protein BWD07_07095 [Neisseria canis]VEF00687.1 Uncharacterised protein [Neisseria canis]
MKYNQRNFPNNRLSRARFAAYCFPSIIILFAMMWLMRDVLEAASHGRQIQSVLSLSTKRTITVFILVGCGLVYYQHKLLMKRCNDAGLGWQVDEILFKLAFVLAATGFLLRPLGLLVLSVVFAQFLYGIYLRSNWIANLNGHPRPNDNFTLLFATASYLISIGLVLVSTRWLETWFNLVYNGLRVFFWRIL